MDYIGNAMDGFFSCRHDRGLFSSLSNANDTTNNNGKLLPIGSHLIGKSNRLAWNDGAMGLLFAVVADYVDAMMDWIGLNVPRRGLKRSLPNDADLKEMPYW